MQNPVFQLPTYWWWAAGLLKGRAWLTDLLRLIGQAFYRCLRAKENKRSVLDYCTITSQSPSRHFSLSLRHWLVPEKKSKTYLLTMDWLWSRESENIDSTWHPL